MITLKDSREIAIMREAGKISAGALERARAVIRPGVSTFAVDQAVREFIESHGATPSFLHYNGFPASACISLNDEVIHGIPSKKRIIQDGDVVSVDVGAYYKGYHSDTAYTFAAGVISEEARRLLEATQECLRLGIEAAVAGARIVDISRAVEQHAVGQGFSVVQDYEGHGVGKNLHEEPSVPNFVFGRPGPRLFPGTTIAIEPMITAGRAAVRVLKDGWTVVTADGSISAHFEHTIAVTSNGPEILTQL